MHYFKRLGKLYPSEMCDQKPEILQQLFRLTGIKHGVELIIFTVPLPPNQ